MNIACLLVAAVCAQDPDWLVVRAEDELPAPMSYDKVVSVYLRNAATLVVAAGEADRHPRASRMVVGTPAANPLVAELAPRLGLRFDGEGAAFQGRSYGPDTGFVLVADDPDGSGRLSLVTASGAEGLLACFTVSLDLTRPGYTIVRQRQKLAAGPLFTGGDTRRPVVVRLDQDVERLAAESEGWPEPDRCLRVARGVAGYAQVFQALYGPQADVVEHTRAVLADEGGRVAAARRAFGKRDLTAEILALYERCRAAVGESGLAAPVIYVVCDPLVATNGKTFDPDPATGRPQVVLNLAVLARDGNFEMVTLHECLHTLQAATSGTRVADRGVREGAATLATQLLEPHLSDAQALMWTEDQLAAAARHRKELVAAFLRDAASTDAGVHKAWFNLDGALAELPGTPSRSGYYVAWLAARAWREAHPKAGAGELLAAGADEILAALD